MVFSELNLRITQEGGSEQSFEQLFPQKEREKRTKLKDQGKDRSFHSFLNRAFSRFTYMYV